MSGEISQINGRRPFLFTAWRSLDIELNFIQALQLLKEGIHGVIIEFISSDTRKDEISFKEFYEQYVHPGEIVQIIVRWKRQRYYDNWFCRVFIVYHPSQNFEVIEHAA